MLSIPLAERARPDTLDKFIGQEHLTGEEGPLRKFVESGNIPSMIFWGPPGTGKTTLAKIIGNLQNLSFVHLSAIQAGVSDIRKVINQAEEKGRILLFLDEIHRFNKGQQDALLGAVESGKILLIGATTENPSFEVNNALLSRCQVYILKELDKNALVRIAENALKSDVIFRHKQIQIEEYSALLRFSGGDGRKLLNILEMLCSGSEFPIIVNDELVMKTLQSGQFKYDKAGEEHYNIISAFIKSIRGSDPNAAVYYLACMIEGGEKPEFIARRMLILASEDIGNANPTALVLANSTMSAVHTIGYPESRIILSQCAIYLACSPKSNSSYNAIESALSKVKESTGISVPLELRNAPSALMKELGYGDGYEYAHSYPGNFKSFEFLPDGIANTKFYEPGDNPREKEIREFLKRRWKDKYGY